MRSEGFTLFELLIVVAIVGFLAAVSVPRYLTHVQDVNLEATAAELMSALTMAKTEASARQTNIDLCFDEVSPNITGYRVGEGLAPSDPSVGTTDQAVSVSVKTMPTAEIQKISFLATGAVLFQNQNQQDVSQNSCFILLQTASGVTCNVVVSKTAASICLLPRQSL